jgi:hypothetical protein
MVGTGREDVAAGGRLRWTPEDGPAEIRTASGARYRVDGTRRVRGGSLAIQDAFVCGAVDRPDGPVRFPDVVVGLRMEIATQTGPVYSSVVTAIVPEAAPEAETAGRSATWLRTA